MKILTFEQARDFIEANKTVPKWIENARREHEDLVALVYGDGYKELIIQIEHLEVEKRKDARRKYSKSIQGLNARLLITLDNVYSATGGSKEYPGIQKMPESDQQAFMKKIAKVRDNKSLEKFLQTYWVKDLHVVDPCGMIMLEYFEDDLDKLQPTYKNIKKIRNYESRGQSVQWVLFEPVKIPYALFKEKYTTTIDNLAIKDNDQVEIIRLVTPTMDFNIVKWNDQYINVDGMSFEHPFGAVPALTNSEKYRLGSKQKLSFINDIIGDEKEYLRDQSVLTLYKYKNGFPIPYMPKLICPACKGRKKDGDVDCPQCGGKGEIMTRDVVDEINLYIDLESQSDIKLPNNWAGYIVPPVETWNQYNKELELSEDDMNFTLYGSRQMHEAGETATARFIDQQPVVNSLNPVSDTAQFMEWQFTEWIANYIFKTKKKEDPVSIIQYGRRYILEQPDVLLKRYEEACEKDMPAVIKDRALVEYLTSKYKNDVVTLRDELIKKEVEPYVHFSVDVVKSLFGVTEARKKVLFNDFWEQLEGKDKENKKREQLTQAFEEWFAKIEFESPGEPASQEPGNQEPGNQEPGGSEE